MPIRLERMSIVEVPEALRVIYADYQDKRRRGGTPEDDLDDARPTIKQALLSRWSMLRESALAQRLEAEWRKRWSVVEQISTSVASSEVLTAAWRGVRTHLLLIVGFSAGINLLYLAPSLYMMQVYDRVLPTGGMLTLLLLSVVLIASLGVMASLDALRGRLLARASLRVERLAAASIVQQAMAARRASSQPGSHPGVRELDSMRTALSSPAMVGLLDIPWTPLFIFICFVIHFWIGMLALAGAGLIFTLALINERASRESLAAVTQRSPRFYAAHESDLGMAETVHALGAEAALTERRLAAREALVDAQTRAAFDSAGYSALTKTVRQLLQSAALGLGCYLAIERMISPGAIIAATILIARAFAPVEQIVGGWRQLAFGWDAFQQLRRAFDKMPVALERTPLPAPAGRISVEQAAAAAPCGRVIVIQGVSFTANPGEIVGIIGPSGAGKTTLARVLANAAPLYSGSIRVDGARYADWDQRALAQHVGYLPQRIDLFDGTITENISCFAASRGESFESVGRKAVAAAQLAGAHELILGLPNGYETPLGLGGAGVSPGQAQRIALARAFYDNPRIIVLDEPNSHLDSEGEAALAQALQSAKARGAVCFVVAHRAGVIQASDKIAVLKDGRLLEYGPRAEILAKLAPAPQQLRPVPPPVRQPVESERS